jgi:hypothetical protein
VKKLGSRNDNDARQSALDEHNCLEWSSRSTSDVKSYNIGGWQRIDTRASNAYVVANAIRGEQIGRLLPVGLRLIDNFVAAAQTRGRLSNMCLTASPRMAHVASKSD